MRAKDLLFRAVCIYVSSMIMVFNPEQRMQWTVHSPSLDGGFIVIQREFTQQDGWYEWFLLRNWTHCTILEYATAYSFDILWSTEGVTEYSGHFQ